MDNELIYFLGSLPVTGQMANGTGCASYLSNCCHPTWTVLGLQVKNCGSYFVFYLKTVPNCNVGYCAR